MTKGEPFDLKNFLPYLLNQAAEAASLEFRSLYRERYGMLRTEWRVLFHLGRYGSMTATDIGQRARLHKTKISRAVRSLEDRRYLSRLTLPEDRRHERLSLTRAGEDVYRELSVAAQKFDSSLAARLSADEQTVLRGALVKLARLNDRC